MNFPSFRFVPDDTKFRFMRFSKPGFFISGGMVVAAMVLFVMLGLNLGIDFKGGTLIEIRTEQAADLGKLRQTLGSLKLGDVKLQELGGHNDVQIRIESQAGGEEAQQAAIRRIKAALDKNVEYRRVESVGPTVSGELTRDGIIAVIAAIGAVLVYIWFRFEWHFSVGAVTSLVHDVLLTIGVFAIFRIEFNLSIIAAILTIVGYSLNDTVVVYDRVRENLRKYKSKPLEELIDLSINQMLPRTILTSVSTLVALLALYFFGGEVIRGFTFTMIWGVIVGTYSSVFIAAPLLIFLGARIETPEEAEAKAKANAARP